VTITIGSLSSGYGGLEMALSSWLGEIDVRWHSEIDPDASLVLKTHWPEVPNLGSFTEPGFWEQAERTHVQCGGIPCQGFSAAGRQLGEADPRHLWPFWRPGIELHRPATVVFENVANLTRGKMRPIFDGIIADLLALGYDVRWCLLGACAVGAAHHRHRVFLLACRSRTTPNATQVQVQTCGRHAAAYVPTPVVTEAKGARSQTSGRTEGKRFNSGTTLGDMVALLRSPNARDGDGARGQGSIEHMRRRMESGHTINLGDQLSVMEADGRWGKYAEAIARHETVLGRPAPEPTEIGPKGGRRLAAAFSEWLMMLPEGHLTSVLDRNPALARAGNGVVPLQAATALGLLFADIEHTGAAQ
jgi:DNA (cytosine-5)-methyltransferase 1